MSFLSNIGFATPLLLWGLVLLPIIWWLLRLTPPRPQRIVFPPIRLLLGLKTQENTPAHSPWWLTALRIILAAVVITALAEPILYPRADRVLNVGPLVLVVDNGWAAADDWQTRQDLMREEIALAQRLGRAVILAPTAPSARPQGLLRQSASDALAQVETISPMPHAPDRLALISRLEAALEGETQANVVWLADGLGSQSTAEFAAGLKALTPDASLQVYRPDAGAGPLALTAPNHGEDGLEIEIMRADKGVERRGAIIARALNGRVLGESPFTMLADERIVTANLDMPLELRNEVSRVEIVGIKSSGAVRLLDDKWRKKRVGLIAGNNSTSGQPLLSPLFYVDRALAPYAELVRTNSATLPEGINDLIDARVSAMVLTDIGTIVDSARIAINDWINDGGVLIRFAGPSLSSENTELVPVRLRDGARALGGTLSWSTPQQLAEFADHGAFNSIQVPGDVTVLRQVLAEPDVALSTRSWARLADGTPLVTAARRGNGWIILFHVPANPSWSNLPLSGAFVDMLRALIDLAGATSFGDDGQAETDQAADAPSLPPVTLLDAMGVSGTPPPTATPIAANEIGDTRVGPTHPPGFYGYDTALRALNTLQGNDVLRPIAALPAGTRIESYVRLAPTPLRPWLLALAAILLTLDSLAILLLRGVSMRRTVSNPLLLAIFIITTSALDTSRAQDLLAEEQFALQATERTRLAYVVTGNPKIDEVSRAGLQGLSIILGQRTALEPGEPMGVDVARDELAFFPLLYWAVDPSTAEPNTETLARIDAYMRRGGTILFDTRDQVLTTGINGTSSNGPGMETLRRMLSKLDIPALEPVPADHVLTKAFYLLQDFPGRYDGGALWTQAILRSDTDPARPARNSDGVSSILITSNDLAAAWAVDDRGRALLPVVPGGDRQREMAYRVGVNLVMYTLTGNYKADQVHIPALLERLGQ